jgi:hypothetical protein
LRTFKHVPTGEEYEVAVGTGSGNFPRPGAFLRAST